MLEAAPVHQENLGIALVCAVKRNDSCGLVFHVRDPHFNVSPLVSSFSQTAGDVTSFILKTLTRDETSHSGGVAIGAGRILTFGVRSDGPRGVWLYPALGCAAKRSPKISPSSKSLAARQLSAVADGFF